MHARAPMYPRARAHIRTHARMRARARVHTQKGESPVLPRDPTRTEESTAGPSSLSGSLGVAVKLTQEEEKVPLAAVSVSGQASVSLGAANPILELSTRRGPQGRQEDKEREGDTHVEQTEIIKRQAQRRQRKAGQQQAECGGRTRPTGTATSHGDGGEPSGAAGGAGPWGR